MADRRGIALMAECGASSAEIRSLIDRYAILGDSGKVDELAALFTADGALVTSNWHLCGRAEIAAGLARTGGKRHPALTFMRHHVTTSDISLTGPDSAVGRTYFLVVTNAGLDRAGTYIDSFRYEAAWLFARREVRIDWLSPATILPVQVTRHAGFAG